MPRLGDVLDEIEVREVRGGLEKTISGIAFDSRKVERGDVFVAVKGTRADGHTFIDKAIQQGAAAVVAERPPSGELPAEITYVRVADTAEALGWMASSFYGHPSRRLEIVGVTGTNGKTTTMTLLHDLFQGLGHRAGLLSTVENRVGEQVLPATHTTPDPLAIHRLLSEMAEAGCGYAFMEVSSHAAHQRRIAGIHFRGAVFTNLTRDHLDYHKTFKAYIEAKKLFFDHLPKTAFALINADDKHGRVMVQNTAARLHTYSLQNLADFRAKLVENTLLGLELEVEGAPFFSRLIGAFNAYNLLAAYGVARLLGFDP
jgi:UDP-N-acetylmuramoyl-L-alanyl-D-glutamate--2,6-diaminopimelate ligase